MTTKIALFGAAGAIGQSIASALRQRGERYRVVGRDVAGLQALYGDDPLAEIRGWDPASPTSIAASADGIDTLIYLVGVPYWKFALHPDVMRKTLDGAVQAGVRNLFLIGNVYPYGIPLTQPIREDHPRAPHTFKGQMRKAQEDIVMQAQADGRITGTVLRLPDFYGPGVAASMLHGSAVAAVRGGTADLIGPIDQPHEFVFVPDVGPVVLKMIDSPETIGRIWHLGGAGVTTQQAMVDEMRRYTGSALKMRVVGKTMLRVLGLFKPMLRELVEMHYLQTTPVIMDDTALQEVIGPIAKTPYREGIRQTLDAIRLGGQHAQQHTRTTDTV